MSSSPKTLKTADRDPRPSLKVLWILEKIYDLVEDHTIEELKTLLLSSSTAAKRAARDS